MVSIGPGQPHIYRCPGPPDGQSTPGVSRWSRLQGEILVMLSLGMWLNEETERATRDHTRSSVTAGSLVQRTEQESRSSTVGCSQTLPLETLCPKKVV